MVTKNATFFYLFGIAAIAMSWLFVILAFDYSLKWNLIYVASASGFDPAIVISAYVEYENGRIGMVELLASLPRVVTAFGLIITFSAFIVIKVIPQSFVPQGYAVFMFAYVGVIQAIDYFTNLQAMDVFTETIENNADLFQDAQLQIIVVDGTSYFLSLIATISDDLATTFFIAGVWSIGLGLKEAGTLGKLPVFFQKFFDVHPYRNETSIPAKVLGGIRDWYNDVAKFLGGRRTDRGSGGSSNGSGSGGGNSSGSSRNSPPTQPPARGGGGGNQSFTIPPGNGLR